MEERSRSQVFQWVGSYVPTSSVTRGHILVALASIQRPRIRRVAFGPELGHAATEVKVMGPRITVMFFADLQERHIREKKRLRNELMANRLSASGQSLSDGSVGVLWDEERLSRVASMCMSLRVRFNAADIRGPLARGTVWR